MCDTIKIEDVMHVPVTVHVGTSSMATSPGGVWLICSTTCAPGDPLTCIHTSLSRAICSVRCSFSLRLRPTMYVSGLCGLSGVSGSSGVSGFSGVSSLSGLSGLSGAKNFSKIDQITELIRFGLVCYCVPR